jgi:hypothetical protein
VPDPKLTLADRCACLFAAQEDFTIALLNLRTRRRIGEVTAKEVPDWLLRSLEASVKVLDKFAKEAEGEIAEMGAVTAQQGEAISEAVWMMSPISWARAGARGARAAARLTGRMGKKALPFVRSAGRGALRGGRRVWKWVVGVGVGLGVHQSLKAAIQFAIYAAVGIALSGPVSKALGKATMNLWPLIAVGIAVLVLTRPKAAER